MDFGRFGQAPAGSRIGYEKGKIQVPADPVIPFLRGDGVGPDIWKATQRVLDAAVAKSFGGKRRIAWFEIYAGGVAKEKFGEWLPDESVDAIKHFRVAIKGPLTTPIGGGIRSLNVALRQILDLYACVRPVRYFQNVPSPVKRPQDVDIVIFRENTEDVYAGIEWPAGSPEAARVAALVAELGKSVRAGSAIGIKPVSEFGSKRLVRKAIQFAIDQKRPSLTLVHKGNIMKFTEGAFRDWGYEVAREEFGGRTITEEEISKGARGRRPARHQGPDRRLDVPAVSPAAGRVFRARDDEPQRRLSFRRARRAGRRPRDGARVPTSRTNSPCSKRRTARRRSMRTSTRSIPAR